MGILLGCQAMVLGTCGRPHVQFAGVLAVLRLAGCGTMEWWTLTGKRGHWVGFCLGSGDTRIVLWANLACVASWQCGLGAVHRWWREAGR
eukprot:11219313-Lingulodinium_polyedra.AAC.1